MVQQWYVCFSASTTHTQAADAIYITPAADEGSLYAQFNRMQIKQISREHVKYVDTESNHGL